MRHTISLRDASRAFSRCIRQVEGGAVYVITRNGKPDARLRIGKLTPEAGEKADGEERITKLLCKIP